MEDGRNTGLPSHDSSRLKRKYGRAGSARQVMAAGRSHTGTVQGTTQNHTIKGASKGGARGRSLPATYLPLGDGTRWRAGWYKLGKPPRISLEPKHDGAIVRVGRRNRSTPRSYEEIHGGRLIPHSKVGRPAFPVERVKFSATGGNQKVLLPLSTFGKGITTMLS